MNKNAMLNAKDLIKKEDNYIKSYLTKLQDIETSIVNADLEIASGHFGCFHYRPLALFHYSQSYAPYVKVEIEYKIESYEDDGIKVLFNRTPLLIPYEFSQTKFDILCKNLFADIKEEMKRCVVQKDKTIKEDNERDKIDKRVGEPHKFQDYIYYWTKCNNCNCGYVYVGTGKWEEDPYSYSDSPSKREVTKKEYCPDCKSAEGLLVYKKQYGSEIRKPCSKWEFEKYEKDFLRLLSGI